MVGSYGASSPEELETMFEDATVLGDPNELAALFVPGAVLHRAGRELPVRGRRGIAELLTERPDRPAYVALTPHILQRGATALVLTGSAVHVTRRSPQGWRYLISWLDG
jgi:hypothetical protein